MNGLPVPAGHWLDPNADEAWRRYYEQEEERWNRQLIDAYFPGTLQLRPRGTTTTGTSTGSPAPTTSSTSPLSGRRRKKGVRVPIEGQTTL